MWVQRTDLERENRKACHSPVTDPQGGGPEKSATYAQSEFLADRMEESAVFIQNV